MSPHALISAVPSVFNLLNAKRLMLCLDTQVYPDSFVFANWLRHSINLVYLNEYGNIVFTSGCPYDNGCLNKTFKLSVEASLYSFLELWDIDLAFIVIHSCVLRNGKTLTIFLLGLELGKAILFTEELYYILTTSLKDINPNSLLYKERLS